MLGAKQLLIEFPAGYKIVLTPIYLQLLDAILNEGPKFILRKAWLC